MSQGPQKRKRGKLGFDQLVLCRAIHTLPESKSALGGEDIEGQKNIFEWTKKAIETLHTICIDVADELDNDEVYGYLRNKVEFLGYKESSNYIAWVDLYWAFSELPIYITLRFATTSHLHRVHVLVHELIHAKKRTDSEYDHPDSFKRSAIFPFGVLAGSRAYSYNPCDDPPRTRKDLKDYFQADLEDALDLIELPFEPVEFCDLVVFKAIRRISKRLPKESLSCWVTSAIETIDHLCLEYAEQLGPRYDFLRNKVRYMGHDSSLSRITAVESESYDALSGEIWTGYKFLTITHEGQIHVLVSSVLQAKAGTGRDITSYLIYPFGLSAKHSQGAANYDYDHCAMILKGRVPKRSELVGYFEAGPDRPEYDKIRHL